MNISIDAKILTVFIGAIIYFTYEAYKMKTYWGKKRILYWLSSRIAIVVLLFLSYSNFRISLKNKDNTTIFLVDNSLSVMEYKNEIENYIDYQIEKKNKKERYAVISFAGDVTIEVPLTYEKQKAKLSSELESNFTDLEKAIDLSMDYFPNSNNKRLVIITDKKENKGDIKSIKDKAKRENINILLKEVKSHGKNDVQLTEIEVPDNINSYGSIPIRVKINSNYKDSGKIHIYMNDKKIISEEIKVVEGNNFYDYTLSIKGEKEILIKGEIDFSKDENKFNNVFSLERKVGNESKILIIGDKEEEIENVNRLLDNLKIKRINHSSNTVPYDVNYLSDFTQIMLINTEYENLPKGFDESLDKAVKNFGTGLLLIGGENSFALGGYEGSKLEDILPTSSRMQNKRKQGDTGLVLLVDASGSMDDESGGVKKIELAKKGAVEAIKALEEEDYIGVLAFSDTLEWIIPYQRVKNRDELINEVGKLRAKGGTLIIPSLIEGKEALKNSSVKVKHMILLTDGQAEKNGFEKYVDDMDKNNITLSTVAVGEDCDKEVLNYLSTSLKGRQYYSKDFRTVPQIISKETRISQKTYLNNERFKPKEYKTQFNSESYQLPELKGYVGTGIKKGATVHLESPKEDPILATWPYGIGKVGVWTSDLNGRWSENWIGWDGFNKYWSSIINYLDKSQYGKEVNLQLKKVGGNVEILVVNKGISKEIDIECLVISPTNKEEKVNMVLNEKGEYVGNFPLKEEGKYKFLAMARKGDKIVDKIEKSIFLDFSPEYEIENDESKRLDEMVMECNGKYLKSNENVFNESIVNFNISYVDLNYILLPLAFLIFLIDILLRIGY